MRGHEEREGGREEDGQREGMNGGRGREGMREGYGGNDR